MYVPKLNIHAGDNSVLLMCRQPRDHAVVFVHGFGGHATQTWSGFEQLTDQVEGWDLFFYGYPSWAGQANSHAEGFRAFLHHLFVDPEYVYSELKSRQYKHILIVAHSLGAVVTRRALLNSALKGHPFLDKISFILFAPAHLGATEITETYGKALDAIPGFVPEEILPERIGNAIASVAQVVVAKSLRDMLKDSVTLRQLEEETRVRLAGQEGGAGYLVARRVVYGNGEDIVDANRFCSDPVPEFYDLREIGDSRVQGIKSRWVPGTDHLAVCKPVGGFVMPLSVVGQEIAKILPPVESPQGEFERDDIEEQLVLDPLKRIELAKAWILAHKNDQVALSKAYRDHRPKGATIIDSAEINVRDGTDLLLDRLAVLQLACLACYLPEGPGLTDVAIKTLRDQEPLRAYYIDYYPQPLVQGFFQRANGDGIADSACGKLAPQAFLRFASIQASFNQPNAFKFRRLLDDYTLPDPSHPRGSVNWLDLQALIVSHHSFQRTLLSSDGTQMVLAAKGYRQFLSFLLDLDDFCTTYRKCQHFVLGVRQFYSYWIVLFKIKFQKLLDTSLAALGTDQNDRARGTKGLENLSRILRELPDPVIESKLEQRTREADETYQTAAT